MPRVEFLQFTRYAPSFATAITAIMTILMLYPSGPGGGGTAGSGSHESSGGGERTQKPEESMGTAIHRVGPWTGCR